MTRYRLGRKNIDSRPPGVGPRRARVDDAEAEIRVLMVGNVSANGGDAAITLAQLKVIAEAANPRTVRVDLIDRYPDVARQLFGDAIRHYLPMLPLFKELPEPTTRRRRVGRRLRRWLRSDASAWYDQLDLHVPNDAIWAAFRESDVVLYAGGTSLVENYSLVDKFALLRVASHLDKPLVLGTQSLGPFEKKAHAAEMRRAAASAYAVLLRDTRSLEHLREIGAHVGNVTVLPDIVFALAPESSSEVAVADSCSRLHVAVSVRSWPHFRSVAPAVGDARYTGALRALVSWLVVEHGAAVTFVSTCQGVPEYSTDDSLAAASVIEGLPPSVRASVSLRSDHLDTDALLRLFGGCDLVVATRMHAAILAFCAGVPVLPIAYEFKTEELFDALGRSDLVTGIEDITDQQLIEKAGALLADLPLARSEVAAFVRRCRREARVLGDVVVDASRQCPRR